ncbi:unnamed protein product [Blepharisma stoltei]|uniref:Tetratricopeptide repeat protein n=1 Tax=Blepharisma stoltei TaxID=1481888 RepID=A0AAU9K0G3_9CILI|nr:unnamed protein product [Blepharisma stoltei]
MNSESLKGPENVNKPIKNSLENEKGLLNSHISTVSSDLNNKSNETESALNVIDSLRNKIAEILSRPNNPELEIDFRTTCSAIQTSLSFYDPPLMQAYQDYLNAYQQKTSLYNITSYNSTTKLHIYNTETETEELKILQIPERLDRGTCITQLPNGKLFCYGKGYPVSGTTVLIDANGVFEVLPSGTPCSISSCIYFDNSVYCFGGKNKIDLTLSCRFDLDQNRWIQLIPMPQADCYFSSIIFKRNILISGYDSRHLLLYSIDIDSFSTVPYKFEDKKKKILINAERLYLIECDKGSIYESEIGSYVNWRRIAYSKLNCNPDQVYCSYNKGGIYISTISDSTREYYYFSLDQKIIIDVAYHNEFVSLRRVGQKIEAIKWNVHNFKLDPYYLDEWNLKGNTLRDLGSNLSTSEWYGEEIKLHPNEVSLYCFKGNALNNLERYLEAIECYDEAIKLYPKGAEIYYKKGYALNQLGRYQEAIESYDEAIKINPNDAMNYNDKGNTLYILERYQEAIQCYDEVIKLIPNNPLYFCKRARAFNHLRQEEAALQDFNRAYNLKQAGRPSGVSTGNEWNLSEKDINFINDLLGRDRIELLQKMQIKAVDSEEEFKESKRRRDLDFSVNSSK